MKRFLGLIMLVVALGALLTACSAPQAAPTATATPSGKKAANPGGASAQGYVYPVRHADLAFRTGGRVVEVLVKEGSTVKAGQPLARLQDSELKAALELAQAQLAGLQAGARPQEIAGAQASVDAANGQVAAAEAALARLQSGAPRQADLASAQAQVAQAAAQLKIVKDSYDNVVSGHDTCKQYGAHCGGLTDVQEQLAVQLRAAQAAYDAATKNLAQVSTGSSSDLKSAKAQVDAAKAQQAAAQAQLNLLKAGSTQEQIQAAQASVAQAQAALDEATLVAPFDGTISDVPVNPGEFVAPGAPIVSLADQSQWTVETDDLSEVDVVNVQPGADATITVDALPGVTMHGKVSSITPRSIVKRGDVTYTAKIAISDPDPKLRWGMTSYVDIRK